MLIDGPVNHEDNYDRARVGPVWLIRIQPLFTVGKTKQFTQRSTVMLAQFDEWKMTDWKVFQISETPPDDMREHDLGLEFPGYKVRLATAHGAPANRCEFEILDPAGGLVELISDLRSMEDVHRPEWSRGTLIQDRYVYFSVLGISDANQGRAVVRWLYPV